MPYRYRAYRDDKKIVEGVIDVASESLAENALYRAGYERVLSLIEISQPPSLEKLLPTLFGVRRREVIEFAGQLATLLESGISLLTALRLLEGQASRSSFRKVIGRLSNVVREGNPLSQGLALFPQVFPESFYQVVRASEKSGNLEAGLRLASEYLEKQLLASQKLRRAMAYPIFVLLMAAAVSILLITVAMPPLIDLFRSLGVSLPPTTRLLISLADFILNHSLLLVTILFILIVIFAFLTRFPSFREARDRLILAVPVIGTINIERSMQRFCQTAAMLLKAGLRLPLIIDLAIQVERNLIIRRALTEVRDKLVQGQGLARPMSGNPIFPSLLVEMVVLGEKTGTLDNALATLATFYERKVERNLDTILSMIEPVLTIVIGVVVIFIALSMITPLYSILRSIH